MPCSLLRIGAHGLGGATRGAYDGLDTPIFYRTFISNLGLFRVAWPRVSTETSISWQAIPGV